MNKPTFLWKEHFTIYDDLMPFFRIAAVAAVAVIEGSYGNLLEQTGGCILLVVYFIYSIVVLVFKRLRKVIAFKHPFYLAIADMILLSYGVVLSGGQESPFYLFYLLFIIFFAVAYGLKYSVIGGSLSALFYAGTILIAGEPFSDEVIFRIVFFEFSAVFAGLLNEKIVRHTCELATHDSLTSLYNTHYFYNSLEFVIQSSMKNSTCVSLAIIDVDNFKLLNDKSGHLGGDLILKEIASLIKSCIRSSDIASRYGGDEFTIILPDTDNDTAVLICERIRGRIQEEFEIKTGDYITVSIGIATYPVDGADCIELFKAADNALYKAKNAGKNIIIVKA